ncbi:hypothetical protein U1E44_01105 [Arenibacter sp. GZD96]|uniref:hypothetical protein n=1 Tax=Aurantibrevibacter litoralis TaxID=3106030 RepID=UPI002AFFEE5E|nr:hypothetical protein [Arenibacter sp. GZD-96]MEA1784678.1 hypothetical protein [Arenibacter sp. GZD-96]
MIKRIAFGFLLLMFCGQIARAQSADMENEIRALSTQKWQWMADKNADALAELFHDKSKFVHM